MIYIIYFNISHIYVYIYIYISYINISSNLWFDLYPTIQLKNGAQFSWRGRSGPTGPMGMVMRYIQCQAPVVVYEGVKR